jgi:hypothetical protein
MLHHWAESQAVRGARTPRMADFVIGLVQSISVRIWTQHEIARSDRRGLPFYSLASAISAPASAVEEGVNAVDSAFVIEYGGERGLPRNTGLIEAIRYLRWLFAALLLSAGSKVQSTSICNYLRAAARAAARQLSKTAGAP